MGRVVAEAERATLMGHVLIGEYLPRRAVDRAGSFEDFRDMRRQTLAPGVVVLAKAVRQLRFAIGAQRHAIGGVGQIFDDARERQDALAEKLPHRSRA